MRAVRNVYQYFGLVLIYLIVFIGSLASILLRTVTAALVQEALQSIFLVALLTTAFMIGRSISAFLSGYISDKIKKKHILAFVGFAILTIVDILYLVLPVEFYHLLRLLMGIASGIAWPMMQRLVLDFSPEKIKHRSMSIYFLLGWLGVCVGYYGFGRIPDSIAMILAISLLAIVTFFTLFLEPPKFEKSQSTKPQKRTIEAPLSTLVFLSLCFGIGISIVSPDFLVGYLLVKFGTKLNVSNILTIASLIGVALSFFLGWIVDKKPSKELILLSSTLIPIGVFGFPFAGTLEAITIDIAFIRASSSSFRPILVAQAKSKEKTGLRVGVINSISNIATSIVLAIIGYFIEAKLVNIIFFVVGLVMFVLILLACISWIRAK